MLVKRKGEVGIGGKGRRGADQIQTGFTLLVDLSIFKDVQLMKNNYHLLIAHYLNACNSVAPYVARVLLGKKEKILLTAVSEGIAVRSTRVSISGIKVPKTGMSPMSGKTR